MWLEPESPDNRPWWVRLILRRQRRQYGQILEPSLWWSRVPFRFVLFALFWRHLDRPKSPLNATLRALLQVRVAHLTGCAFCVDLNSLHFFQRSGEEQKLNALQSDSPPDGLFSPAERAALAYAEALTATPVQVGKELQTALRASFSDEDLVELTALIAFQNMSARFNSGLELPPQGLCQLPEKQAGG